MFYLDLFKSVLNIFHLEVTLHCFHSMQFEGAPVSSNDLNPIVTADAGFPIRRRFRPLPNPTSTDETGAPHTMIQGFAPRRIRLQRKLQISCSFKSGAHQSSKPEEEQKPVIKEVFSFEAAI